MATHTSIIITPANTLKELPVDYSPLLLLSITAAATYHYSKREMRKAQKKMAWQVVKMKWQSMFSGKSKKGSGLKLILILLGIGFIVGIGALLDWSIAIAILVVGGLIGIIYSGKG
jgi:hypothetical protein